MKQIEIVETNKDRIAYNKKLKFLKKNHYDNVSAKNRTTDGNLFSKYKNDANYWLLKIKEFEAVHFTVGKIQDEIFKEFNEEEEKLTQAQRDFKCTGCDCLITISKEDAEWKQNELNKPCFVTECNGSLSKDCHPEFFLEQCASCEVQGEIDAGF